jgi:uncharacterized protein (TIGR02246 family)
VLPQDRRFLVNAMYTTYREVIAARRFVEPQAYHWRIEAHYDLATSRKAIMNSTADSIAILRNVLDPWKDGVDSHEPQRVASLFTEDAIFQGLHPYSVGREGVAAYYESQPRGLTATYRILEARQLAADVVQGYVSVDFMFTDRPSLNVYLCVLVKRVENGWRICHYQVSLLH